MFFLFISFSFVIASKPVQYGLSSISSILFFSHSWRVAAFTGFVYVGPSSTQNKTFIQILNWLQPRQQVNSACQGCRIGGGGGGARDVSLPVLFLGIGELGGGLGRHQLKGRQWAHVLTLHFNRVVNKWGTVTLKYNCRPTGSPTSLG